MSLNVVILTRTIKSSFILLPAFLERIRRFEDGDWTIALADTFEEAFCRASPLMLGIALVDEKGNMRGHCVAGMETFAGKTQPVIHQLAKDQGFDDQPGTTTAEVQSAVEAWATMAANQMGTRITHVFISVLDEKRERLFERFGYTKGPRLMRKGL